MNNDMIKFNKENQFVKYFQILFINYLPSKSFIFLLITMLFGFCIDLLSVTADSSKINILNNFSLNVSGNHNWYVHDGTDHAIVPRYTASNNNNSNYYNYNLPDKSYRNVSDNPLFHGAAYVNFDLGYKSNGFTISSNIITEHRGISYGVYNTKAMIVYPKFKFAFDTCFTVFGEKISAGVFVGNFDNLRMFEGLTIYNLDAQGNDFYIKWKHLKLEFHKIGDLLECIGLNIDDENDFILSVEDLNIINDISADIRVGTFTTTTYNFSNRSGINYSVNFHNDNFKIYSQLGLRSSSVPVKSSWNSAFLAGTNMRMESENYKFDFTGEYRYYGCSFNQDYINYSVSYRPNGNNTSYNNTIGENLYPLSLYDRPFSQWNVYTEYQGKNVIGLSFLLKSKMYFYDKFAFNANFDINYIKASFLPGFWYSFYDIGLDYEPVKNNYIMLSYTNKAMNLDKPLTRLFICGKSRLLNYH